MDDRPVRDRHLIMMNHHDPVMAAHQVGGDSGRVAIASATAKGVPGFKGDTVTSPADLPNCAPIPQSALGPALNEQGYYVGRVERNPQIMQSYRLDRVHSGPVHP
jgi:hypothetical protein